ncbi:MAG: YihY/virulence factor BrkB family protein [Muribaculaceae bacterium]|nr:YihY/virulence factor BrkB family protein [Muribaculaceae bacterium]
MSNNNPHTRQSLASLAMRAYRYCTHDVWNIEGSGKLHKIVKAANLAIRCFFNQEVQERACALTYRTVLALVPALAMLFAIARGFGFQNLIHGQLIGYLPSQRKALEQALTFVDRYLEHASEGAFVGIGLLVLLYTLVMLMGNVESTFNKIWGLEHGRPLYRKVTDYTALFVFIPVLMICSAGISLMLTSMGQHLLPLALSPVLHFMLDCVPLVLVWLMFTFAFWLIPHTKVSFRYALISGVVFGSLFFLLQWVFVRGQILVSGYNAIYGSFAFLPLLLFWMQLSWMLVLLGTVMTYSLQNIYGFNYSHHEDVNTISTAYLDEITIMSLALIVKRFENGQPPMGKAQLSGDEYNIPIHLANRIIDRLLKTGLITEVRTDDGDEAFLPAFTIEQMTLHNVKQRLSTLGSNRFLTVADRKFAGSYDLIANAPGDTLVKDLL